MTDIISSEDPRARLRTLRAIPERDRTDAQWDELNELEIQLAPVNRIDGPGEQPTPASNSAARPGAPRKKPWGKHSNSGKRSPRAQHKHGTTTKQQ
jgi:hypothetical protein